MNSIWHRLDLDDAVAVGAPARLQGRITLSRAASSAQDSPFAIELRPLLACRALATEWDDLAERAIEPNIFAGPEMLLAAARWRTGCPVHWRRRVTA
jgi:hypothetical protein